MVTGDAVVCGGVARETGRGGVTDEGSADEDDEADGGDMEVTAMLFTGDTEEREVCGGKAGGIGNSADREGVADECMSSVA